MGAASAKHSNHGSQRVQRMRASQNCNPSGTTVWVPFENGGATPTLCSLGNTDEEVQYNMGRVQSLANCCGVVHLPDASPCVRDMSLESATAASRQYVCR